MQKENKPLPAILAPAGNRASFLAALAAGADAVYCGLKQFSARMEAKNFSPEELAPLTKRAHDQGTSVYVTLNTMLRAPELEAAGQMIEVLQKHVKPDALIIQDTALIPLAKQAGFSGEIHLSTLANVSFPAALDFIRKKLPAQVTRVVIPRELNIDEIKEMGQKAAGGPELEVFIHGALCYGVSGRCYWSSYLGGKSGLQGRCVQPCRRRYSLGKHVRRYFSCQDLSLDVLAKVLLSVPAIRAWKIEGRKKSPHYVFYTVKAYQMLRDHATDPQADSQIKKDALSLLSQALGRSSTHYFFLPQRPQNPVNTAGQTGSGLLLGSLKGGKQPYITPRQELLPGDMLRIGYEDEKGHSLCKISRYVPKGGKYRLQLTSGRFPAPRAPVFLTDRREKALQEMIAEQEEKCSPVPEIPIPPPHFSFALHSRKIRDGKSTELSLFRHYRKKQSGAVSALWLSPENVQQMPPKAIAETWWWLPPVIWPKDEALWAELTESVMGSGAQHFVLNMPWQMAFFQNAGKKNLWAGPFCNMANPLSLQLLKDTGFAGVILSPELGREDYLHLPSLSPLPLGIVLAGNWPLCVSRALAGDMETETPFSSPKQEQAWVKHYGADYWVYPEWQVDFSGKEEELRSAGYRLFVRIHDPLPKGMKLKQRPGLWNWNIGLPGV